MSSMEWYLLGVTVVGLVIWAHGCVKRSPSSCVLGLLLGVVAAVSYFVVFSLTRTSYFAAYLLASYLIVLLPFNSWMRTGTGKVLAGAVVVLAAAAALAEFKVVSMGNAMLVIEPYRAGTTWRFDEPRLNLKGEPFVGGMSEMIDKMVAGMPSPEKKVRLIFSQQPFPGWQYRLDLSRPADGGNWYYNEQYKMEGWLCPALFKFFPRAPQHIYGRAEPS